MITCPFWGSLARRIFSARHFCCTADLPASALGPRRRERKAGRGHVRRARQAAEHTGLGSRAVRWLTMRSAQEIGPVLAASGWESMASLAFLSFPK